MTAAAQSAESRPEAMWQYMLAGALLTGAPVWNYLYVNGYPFSRIEAWLLPMAAAMVGGGIAIAAWRLGPTVGSLAFGALLLCFLDLQFDIGSWKLSTIALAGLCVAASLVLRSRRAVLTCIILITFNLASLPRPRVPTAAAALYQDGSSAHERPLLVHIVLDEQWGVGGLRAAGDTTMAAFLTDFYVQRGFEVYEGAYSRWDETWQSLPALMSAGRAPDVEKLGRFRYRLKSNPYFKRLRELGYDINVFQSSHLDYCHTAGVAVASCSEVPAVTIANIGYLDGPWMRRAVLASRFFLNLTSYAYVRLHPDSQVWRRSFAGRGLAQLEDVRQAIAAGGRGGTAIFVHLLLPHRPLEVDAQCRAYADADDRVDFGWPSHLSDSLWRERLGQYAAQTRCVHDAVADLIATVDSVVGRHRSIVIVHGDHGARFNQHSEAGETLAQLNEQQLNAWFSTLLAVRRPGVPASIHDEPVPVQDYFWALQKSDFQTVPRRPSWRHFVMRVRWEERRLPVPPDTVRVLSEREMLWAQQHD